MAVKENAQETQADPRSETGRNAVVDLFTNFKENTLFKSPLVSDSYRQPYSIDDLWQKTGDYSIYERMCVDDQVSVCLRLKKDLVLGEGGHFVAEDDGQEEIVEDLQQAFFEEYEGDFAGDLEEILTSYEFGFSITEKVFHQREGGFLGPKFLRTRHPNSWRLYQDDTGKVTKYEQVTSKGNLNINPKSIIHMINDPRFQNPYGTSDLRSAYYAYVAKTEAIKYLAIFLEKAASPIPVGRYDKNAPQSAVDKLFDILKRFQTKTAITIPKDIEVEFLEAKNTGEAYVKAIHLFNMFIGRALFIPDLVGFTGSETGGGSLALGKEQMNLFFMHIYRRRAALENIINRQLVQPQVVYNYGNVAKYPKFRFRPLDDMKAVELAKIWLDAVKGKTFQANEEEINHFRKLVKFPEGEVVFAAPAPNPLDPNSPPPNGEDESEDEGGDEGAEDVSEDGAQELEEAEPKTFGGPGSGPRPGKGSKEKSAKEKKGSSKSAEPSEEETKAIGTYTGSLSSAMIAADSNPDGADEFVKSRNQVLNNYLDRAPKFEGDLHRGISVEKKEVQAVLDKYKPGDTVSLEAKQSWTKDPKAVKDRLTSLANNQKEPTSIMFEYPKSKAGVDVSKHSRFPEEAEVLMPKGSAYRVKEVVKEKSGYRIVMEHAEPKKNSARFIDSETVSNFAKAYNYPEGDYHKKVDFKAVENKLNDYDASVMNDTRPVVKKMLRDLLDQIERKKILSTQNVERIDTLDLKYKKELKQILKASFTQLYKDAQSQAASEILKSDFARKGVSNQKFLDVIESETFNFVGDYEYGILKKVRTELVAAIKDGKPLSAVTDVLDRDLSKLTQVQLERFARTKHTEVMNTARVEFFQDSGVIAGYQYSAILDDVTTNICGALHGKKFAAGDEPIPPLHFNCRSVLIPITKYEEFKPTETIRGQAPGEFIEENKGEGFATK